MARTWEALPLPRATEPTIRRITLADIPAALREGWRDFEAGPTQLVFLCLIYPVMGLLLARFASGAALLPLLYPLLSGFALVAPLFALGIYELSRRIERGEQPRKRDMLAVLRAPNLPSILLLGAVLLAVFAGWLWAAKGLWAAIMGPPPEDLAALWQAVTGTPEGTRLLLAGNALGAAFALLVLGMTVISFPLMLDRGVGLREAVRASMAALNRNPVPIIAWGAVVAVLLALGMATLMVGLAIVLPWLGHATWRLYRRLV